MIDIALSASISGMKAAERRLEVSANNIANSRSTTTIDQDGTVINRPYQPQQILQVSESPAGTRTITSPIDPATIPSFEPDHPAANENGIVQLPNVDEAHELANQVSARVAFQSSLATLGRSKELFENVINILA